MSTSAGKPSADKRSSRDERRQRAKLWTLLVLAIAIGIAAALVAFALLIGAIEPRHHGKPNSLGQAIALVACLSVLLLFSRAVIVIEHRLRRHGPEAQALDAAHTARVQGNPSRGVLRRRRHHFGPLGTMVFCLVEFSATAAFVILTISSHSQDARSSFVQHHGTKAGGVVRSIDNRTICDPDPRGAHTCFPSAGITVSLTAATDRVRTTTVHHAGPSHVHIGERISVLLDPRQPGYAELPGAPYRRAGGWILVSLIAALFAALACVEARSLARALALRRRHRRRSPTSLRPVARSTREPSRKQGGSGAHR